MSTLEPAKSDAQVARPPVETLVFKDEPASKYWAVFSELAAILKDLWHSPDRAKRVLPPLGIVICLIGNVTMTVYLNNWNGDFYRSIERKDLPAIWHELLRFAEIIGILLTLVVTQTWLSMRWKIELRTWLTKTLLDRWLVPGRAYRLSISSDDAVNPDQRIQEDTRNLCDISSDLSIGLLHSTLMLVCFIGVLWAMSQNITFSWHDQQFKIPGYMVWMALIYTMAFSWLTAKIGRPLIDLNEERYTREANFRFSIVRVNESAESIAFYSGEKDERKIINSHFSRVMQTMLKMTNAVSRLTWITSGYGWLVRVIPVLCALPGYLQGALDLGGLMMVVGAFNEVQGSLRWFVDNYQRIADWRTALHRVTVFRDAVAMVDEFENKEAQQIQLLDHPEGFLSFEGTKVSLIDGEVVIADATAQVRPAERVLIVGESGSGKSTLFRAVGGLWPWGSGIIKLPPRDEMMFLPQRPYMPLGTLAAAVTYPMSDKLSDREQVKRALERVNLVDFIPMLDSEERWDRLMSLGQQQRLAFARLLIHKPKWVFLDEATSALDDENQDLVMTLFLQELNETTVLSIGHRPNLAQYHTRTLHLMTTSQGTILRRRPQRPKKAKLWARTTAKLFRRKTDRPNKS